MKFSVLMSVYRKEEVEHLNLCLKSLADQTLQADEVVLVKDGKLTEELDTEIDKWLDVLPIKIIAYEKNMGLGYALQKGLNACSHELVARMDADDIAYSYRFEKQIAEFENDNNLVLLGGQIEEFIEDPNIISGIRSVPENTEDIIKFLKSRNAFSHMTVMFKKAEVLSVGGYKDFTGFEDYYLWIRLAQADFEMRNLPDVLVKVRVGNDMVGRRIGFKYALVEKRFFKKLYKMKFLSYKEYVKIVIVRVPLRLIPKRLLLFVYKILRK